MPAHRRYTKREKATAVIAAEMTNVTAAAESMGIPATTIDYWMTKPEFVQLREKTREELGDGFKVLAHLAQARLSALIPTMEPRDLTILLGVAVDKSQLLSGQATERTENRDLTYVDHEADILGEVVRAELARRTDERSAEDAVERAGSPGAEAPAG